MENQAKKIITATLIVNPVSGVGNPLERRKLLKSLAKDLGWVGNYIETIKEISANQIAKTEIARGITHIIACGGDGTIMEVLEALLDKKVVLGIVPLGTGNILARNLSIPLDTNEALKIAFFGNPRLIDAGKANDNYFSIIAGIGLDAEIMRSTGREVKDRWGLFAYVVAAIKNLLNKHGTYEIKLDNKKPFTVKAKTIMASNMGKLMGGVEIIPSTHPQSGSLQLCIIKARSLNSWMNLTISALSGKIEKSNYYAVYEAKKIEIDVLSGKKLYECDGDHFPPTQHLSIQIYPKAVSVMVKQDVITSEEEKGKGVLLFDFDGTLADSLDMIATIYNSLAKKHNYPSISAKKIEELRGLSMKDIITQLPISKIKLPFLYAEGRGEFKKNLEFLKPFPGLSSVLSDLSKKYTMGIVTSNDSTNVKKFLLFHKLDYFDFIYSDKSLFGKGKIIRKVLKKYDFSKNDVIYVGDEIRDIDAAREAGIRMASVSWGFNSKVILKSNKPDFLVDSPSQLASTAFFKKVE